MKNIVMTGATAGLGAVALQQFVSEKNTRVTIGARGTGRAVPEGVDVIPLDLESLASVRSFADAVKQRLGSAPIDVLVLNAGAQYRKGGHPTAEGFEPTFAVNHLAHYLLARLLVPSMAEGGRLVITTSDTHDPAIIPFGPRALDVQQLAHPERAGFRQAIRAYASSKLCNLLTARSFAALDEVQKRHIEVIAYNPGLTLGTNLGRAERGGTSSGPPSFVRALLGVVSKLKPAFYPGTVERAGDALAQLSLGTVAPPPGRIYASLVRGELTFPDPSELARSDEARDRLWRESTKMVGLSMPSTA
jgi:NAD(P)-dependent dehydrogenase (short-subunit alcohol dehydrogenase family)